MTVLTFPAGFLSNQVSFYLKPTTMTFVSDLNNGTRTREIPGARWSTTLTFSQRPQEHWRPLTAFVAQCRGRAGRVYMSPWHARNPQGVGGGNPKVKGGDQTGNTLNVDGLPGNTAGWLKVGDFFSFPDSVGYQMKMVVGVDVDSDTGGNATITFEPPLRGSPADNADITIVNPICIMGLVDDEQGRLDVIPPVQGDLTLQFEEMWEQ